MFRERLTFLCGYIRNLAISGPLEKQKRFILYQYILLFNALYLDLLVFITCKYITFFNINHKMQNG